MQFILTPGSIEQFDNLRTDYERERKINLKATPSMFGMPTLFQGPDVKNRCQQISFLEKIKWVLQRYLIKDEEIKTSEQWQAKLMASRILISSALFIQHEIGRSKENSVLYRLINKYLGITETNDFDDQDKESCYQTVAQFVYKPDSLKQINRVMQTISTEQFSQSEWRRFSHFIKIHSNKQNFQEHKTNNYPVTSLISPVFETAFSFVGSTIGWVVAETVISSSIILSPRVKMTSLIGTLLVIGPAGSTGIALLAPVIASKLISSFCTNSLSNLSETTMRLLGKGTGFFVGLPFDLVYNLLKASGTLIMNYTFPPPISELKDGIRIADGVYIVQGNPMQLNLISQQKVSEQRLQITAKGEFFVDGQPIENLHNPMALMIQELEEQFARESEELQGTDNALCLK